MHDYDWFERERRNLQFINKCSWGYKLKATNDDDDDDNKWISIVWEGSDEGVGENIKWKFSYLRNRWAFNSCKIK